MSTLEKLGVLPLAPPEELLPPLDIPPLEAPPLEAPPLEEPDDLSLPEAPLDEDPGLRIPTMLDPGGEHGGPCLLRERRAGDGKQGRGRRGCNHVQNH